MEQIKIKFRHFPHPRVKDQHPTRTVAEIYDNGELIAEGFSDCSSKDNFNYATGRKYAFMRAVDKLDNKALKETLWEKLSDMSPKTIAAKTH